MVAEALCALGRPEAVIPWIDGYRRGMEPREAPREAIQADGWQTALGVARRYPDWCVLMTAELASAPWAAVLARWVDRLAPGISADATHGVIRVGHAARGLAAGVTPPRLRELADALALLASTYQELPTARDQPLSALRPAEAIERVTVVPPDQRRFSGTIVSSLEALNEFPPFAGVIGLVDASGDPAALISELTETFARVYLANARDVLTAIVFIHGVTSVAALRDVLPHLDDAARRSALGFAWQAGCALYAAFGSRPTPAQQIAPPRESAETLVEMALANGDEHAIKFTEACLREDALNPSAVYLSAARSALDLLPPR
jgi:hypothetical protein